MASGAWIPFLLGVLGPAGCASSLAGPRQPLDAPGLLLFEERWCQGPRKLKPRGHEHLPSPSFRSMEFL